MRKERVDPFCLMLSIPDPHTPFQPRAPYDTMFFPENMEIPESYFEQSTFEPFTRQQGNKPDEATLRQFKAWYHGAVKLIDDNVGKLLACLEEKGMLDDTIVVFTSDHGEYMGEHGLMGKNTIYETAHRVPFLIRWPEKITSGSVVDRVVASVDFQKTLLGLVGLEPCGREQGRDASGLLCGDDSPWEDVAYIHHPSYQWAGVFTSRYEYAVHRDGYSVLFDRNVDPHQTTNLARQDGGHPSEIQITEEALSRHYQSTGSPVREWLG
jgi:arylsulfatase A-like enzyme